MSRYDVYIGLEIHIHLLTASKMFCACPARFGDAPNSNVCPVCLGWPGTLPALNRRAVELGYRVATALGCSVGHQAVFARKNYFYPDMPKNYQISQFGDPIGRGGRLDFPAPGGGTLSVRMRECHLEEDAGKMIHAGDISLIDYNRAGYPLLEVVTEPDMRRGEEAEAFLHHFRRLVRYLGASDGNMEEGSLRCDANVSLNAPGAGLGTKVEIKNLNSSRFVRLALDYEISRQAAELDAGRPIVQETRLWNENRDCTVSMRGKESSHDYRYFPEPDLPPFNPEPAFLDSIAASMPELPLARLERLARDYGLGAEVAEALCEERELADYFESAVKSAMEAGGSAMGTIQEAGRTAANWILGALRKELNRAGLGIGASPMGPARLASLLAMLARGRIQGKTAKQVLARVFAEDADPETIIAREGLEQISSPEALAALADKVLSANADVLAAVRAGDAKKKEFLIGRAMAESGGRAAPAALRAAIEERIRSGA